jgi:hypothetical protein
MDNFNVTGTKLKGKSYDSWRSSTWKS